MNWDLCSFIQKPAYQALMFLLLTPILLFIFKPKSADRAWLIAVCTFVVFLIVNAVLLWFDHNPWHYFFYSIAFAVGYILCIAVVMQAIFKVLKLKNSQESAMAFIVIIYQPFTLLLVMLIKWIVTNYF